MLIVHKSFSKNALVDFVCKKFFSPVFRLNYESAVDRGKKIVQNVKKVTRKIRRGMKSLDRSHLDRLLLFIIKCLNELNQVTVEP